MENIQTNQKFFTRQELGTVIFSVMLTAFMVAMMVFAMLYKTGDAGGDTPTQSVMTEMQS